MSAEGEACLGSVRALREEVDSQQTCSSRVCAVIPCYEMFASCPPSDIARHTPRVRTLHESKYPVHLYSLIVCTIVCTRRHLLTAVTSGLTPPPFPPKVSGLKKVKLVDASWIWTEPHSRRLKLKLTVQKEVGNGAVLQQAMAVTFVVRNQQCDNCAAAFTNNTWTAVVQVRQRVDHKRTFFYLEQLILKHSAHSQCTNIQVRTAISVLTSTREVFTPEIVSEDVEVSVMCDERRVANLQVEATRRSGRTWQAFLSLPSRAANELQVLSGVACCIACFTTAGSASFSPFY